MVEWKAVTPTGSCPSARVFHSDVVVQSSTECYMLVFGGDQLLNFMNDLYKYSFTTNNWEKVPTSGNTPSGRLAHSAVVYSGNMIVFGGKTGILDFSNEVFVFEIKTRQWSRIGCRGDVPSSRCGHAYLVDGDCMYMFGGHNNGDCFNDLYTLNLRTFLWTRVPVNSGDTQEVPTPRWGSSLVRYGDKLYLYGGRDDTVEKFNDFYELHLDTHTWRRVRYRNDYVPTARCLHRSTAVDDSMYVYGGHMSGHPQGGPPFEVYHFPSQRWYRVTESGNVPATRWGHSAVLHVRSDGTYLSIFGGAVKGGGSGFLESLLRTESSVVNDMFTCKLSSSTSLPESSNSSTVRKQAAASSSSSSSSSSAEVRQLLEEKRMLQESLHQIIEQQLTEIAKLESTNSTLRQEQQQQQQQGETVRSQQQTRIQQLEQQLSRYATSSTTTTAAAAATTTTTTTTTAAVAAADDVLPPEELLEVSYEECEEATDGFRNRIGGGGFGDVFKGTLKRYPHMQLAFKKMAAGALQDEVNYQAEMKVLRNYRHRCIIRLVGFCEHGQERILVYEFMSGGELTPLLCPKPAEQQQEQQEHQEQQERKPIENEYLLHVMILHNVATALGYCHTHMKEALLHLDVSSNNILLTDVTRMIRSGEITLMDALKADVVDFAKVTDFGLARNMKVDDRSMIQVTQPLGQYGYIAPEMLEAAIASPAADVYSFGVILLQHLYGTSSVNLVNRFKEDCLQYSVPELYHSDCLSTKWSRNVPPQLVTSLLKLALSCTAHDRKQRPTMLAVVHQLHQLIEQFVHPLVDAYQSPTLARMTTPVAANTNEPPRYLLDPITRELYDDPVITPSGVTYSRAVIEQWIDRWQTDPKSEQPLRKEQLIPNQVAADAVLTWSQPHGSYRDSLQSTHHHHRHHHSSSPTR